ncbi:hypothetical protein IF1G_10720 [Cordyceps javanica]|uniref:Uncharacterized protein n=1 Tax=Cordyceps javanica TaxID=43265 RepID=A0A545UM70_9HYPO|nr:hypothetical protein IF1G_10720 [Cordyceps javanica]
MRPGRLCAGVLCLQSVAIGLLQSDTWVGKALDSSKLGVDAGWLDGGLGQVWGSTLSLCLAKSSFCASHQHHEWPPCV